MNSNGVRRWLAAACAAGLSAATGSMAQEFQDNVVIVLDASGSMKDPMPGASDGNKMAAAKIALRTVLQQVPETTHIGLLVFSARGIRDPWVYPLGPRNTPALLEAIDRIEPYGNTPLGQYLKLGADRLLQERTRQYGYGSYRLLVVTDGEAQDQDLVTRYTPDIISRGITMDVIGVAMNRDHTLARKAHSYRRANDSAALQTAVAEVLAEVSRPRSDVAQNVEFDLLAPIPDEVAAAALQALSTSGNHPIGTSPRSGPSARPRVDPDRTPPTAQQPAAPAPPAPHHQRKKPAINITYIVTALVVLSFVGRLFRSRRR
ncbi:MAG TPA: VWA domain-containing protein [Verrucomicrobiota bacterium]|nr:VWA domain-containing protein [Verrucomicrobiota bacterium]HNU49939.1 VWA domain-containing protein [Verrucomicrobiota bacterium]